MLPNRPALFPSDVYGQVGSRSPEMKMLKDDNQRPGPACTTAFSLCLGHCQALERLTYAPCPHAHPLFICPSAFMCALREEPVYT